MRVAAFRDTSPKKKFEKNKNKNTIDTKGYGKRSPRLNRQIQNVIVVDSSTVGALRRGRRRGNRSVPLGATFGRSSLGKSSTVTSSARLSMTNRRGFALVCRKISVFSRRGLSFSVGWAAGRLIVLAFSNSKPLLMFVFC